MAQGVIKHTRWAQLKAARQPDVSWVVPALAEMDRRYGKFSWWKRTTKRPPFPHQAAKAWRAGKLDGLTFATRLADYLAKMAEAELN